MQDAARVLFAATGGRTLYGIDYSTERELSATVHRYVDSVVRDVASQITEELESIMSDVIFGDSQRTAERSVALTRSPTKITLP